MNDAETPDESVDPGLDFGSTAAAAGATYRVLARKYRPATFADLIGQDAMVRTLSNAFETGRIPQAWILTGVRGVGKTTTARILARALNFQRADGSGGPAFDMPTLGVHCQAIMESRHLDVIEMDAASHNSVEDVRAINDAIRYAPVSARYKVYILDEVHMLSGQAFNALLKTLEEPPPHVKFVFATTEIRKVPVTVLSRCQRFDLRRVETGVLVTHLDGILAREKLSAEPEALALIARAAEGSVRDALSLLDQAIAHSGQQAASAAPNVIRAADVRQMLGLADRARVIDLFDGLMRGDVASALKELRDQYDSGADPVVVVADLADFTHLVTRIKVVPAMADDVSLAEVERARGRDFAAGLSMRVLSRTWQMLFKGLSEVQAAPKPITAAEMLLVRIAYAADLPTPDEVIRTLRSDDAEVMTPGPGQPASPAVAPLRVPSGSSGAGPRPPVAAALSARAPAPEPADQAGDPGAQAALPQVMRFEDLIALAAHKRDLTVKTALERDVRLVRFEDGKLELALEPGAVKTLVNDLSRKLAEWTGRPWMVVVSSETGEPTLKTRLEQQRAELVDGIRADPLVKAVMARFPGAEIVDVRRRPADSGADPALAEYDTLSDPVQEDDGSGADADLSNPDGEI